MIDNLPRTYRQKVGASIFLWIQTNFRSTRRVFGTR